MNEPRRELPAEVREFFDSIVKKELDKLRKDRKKLDPAKNGGEEKLAMFDESALRFESRPYETVVELLLGRNSKTGKLMAPKVMMGTHIGKLVSPNAKASVLARAERAGDGFVRTGNCRQAVDVCVNAANLPSGEFLSLEVDGRPMYSHFVDGDDVAQAVCALSENPAEALEAFRSMRCESGYDLTGLRQVHFPAGDGFHIIAPLNPSYMFSLTDVLEDRGVIQHKGEKYEDFKKREDILLKGLWIMHHGSTKPQNVSVLNNSYNGNVLMLPSFPPALEKRSIRIPRTDFFSDCLNPRSFDELLERLNRAVLVRHNNIRTRELPMNVVREIALDVADRVEELRNQVAGLGYDPEMDVPAWQKDMISMNGGWFGDFAHGLAVWIHNCYERKFDVILGDDAIDRFEQAICEMEAKIV